MYIDLFVILGGYLISMCLCAIWWDKGPAWKFLPILYGIAAGIIMATWATSLSSGLERILSCFIVGLMFWFSVWVQSDEKPK